MREGEEATHPYLSASQLERRNTRPTLRDRLARIVADREPQRRHPLHVRGALSAVGSGVSVVCDLVGVHAVGEAKDGLHVSAARRARERRSWPRIAVLGPVAVAPPCDGGDFLVCENEKRESL
jgi:hypothetical protein